MQELLASYERMEARPIPPPDEGTAVIFTPRPEPPAPAEMAAVEVAPAAVEAPRAIVETPSSAEAAAAPPADADFDPADFLFGPEPEPDPAAFLLEPSPPESASAVLPPAELAATPPAAEPPAAEERRGREPTVHTTPAASAPDPLAPLNAMTEAERIAIFS